MKKRCETCIHYSPTFFGIYKGEFGDGKCEVDDLCTNKDEYCECYKPIAHVIIECEDNEPPF